MNALGLGKNALYVKEHVYVYVGERAFCYLACFRYSLVSAYEKPWKTMDNQGVAHETPAESPQKARQHNFTLYGLGGVTHRAAPPSFGVFFSDPASVSQVCL